MSNNWLQFETKFLQGWKTGQQGLQLEFILSLVKEIVHWRLYFPQTNMASNFEFLK